MKRLIIFTSVVVLGLFLTGCITDSDSDKGPLNTPDWLVGTWEGGSPILLHIEFTKNNCYDEDGNEELDGYIEDTVNDQYYVVHKDNMVLTYKRISATSIDWKVDNGVLQNTTRMYKQ